MPTHVIEKAKRSLTAHLVSNPDVVGVGITRNQAGQDILIVLFDENKPAPEAPEVWEGFSVVYQAVARPTI